ncbi:hypothetical protein NX059_012283 [Plenodomus lindquistii]|nr:hypothetical protein NX059_012283 [Plenodomus lindquistii]
MHVELFLQGRKASHSVKDLLTRCAKGPNRVSNGKRQGTKHKDALPAIHLALEQRTDALASSRASKDYGSYFDANLSEAKRFIALVHRIQIRYRQIGKIWPRRQTLLDVLRTCDEALEFRRVELVAKFITKTEKLYTKEYNTAIIFNGLTNPLVSWRQLELTIEVKLFNLKEAKFRDNAKSWFFIAFEIIIAAVESTKEKQNIRTHAKNLFKSLKGFFKAITMG